MSRSQTFPLLCLLLVILGFLSLKLNAQDIYISNRNGNSVKLFDGTTGGFIKDFVASGSGGLSAPQEVIFLPDGSLMVTGRFNTALKRYDGQTGAYLGDFTTGYTLDNPTKTTIGPDSLIYVSQWGQVQNKVVRFDLQGQFVDEFTDINVPQGMGHAWDSTGNYYVCRWGQGNAGEVLKFDSAGTSLGVFVPSGIIQGPVNLFFDHEAHLNVLDWTTGELVRFHGQTGAFLDKPATGMTNPEGWVFDTLGLLYLCDWSLNRVYRVDTASGSRTNFITTGSLGSPNGITFGPEYTVIGTADDLTAYINVELVPHPSSGIPNFQVAAPSLADIELNIVSLEGKHIGTVYSGMLPAAQQTFSWPHKPLSPGVYLYQLKSAKKQVTGRFIVQ